MTTVAIICEYNPFHNGHKYHLDKIREEFGSDTAIIAIMSGNYTQRGELAILPKQYRAKAALLSGIDLVLELPFPFSSSSAEIFARSAVSIIDSLGIVDVISFGSESGDINSLIEAASVFESEAFASYIKQSSNSKALGYPKLCEEAFNAAGGKSCFDFTSNNILAIEYIKALRSLGSRITPHTVLRNGSPYNSNDAYESSFPSALSIRNAYIQGDKLTESMITKPSLEAISEATDKMDMPTDVSRLSAAIISYLRINPPSGSEDIYDAKDGIYNRLYNASQEASDVNSLLRLCESKSYTNARYRRAMWNIFFGVTSSDVKVLPEYTQLLGANSIGLSLLKKAGASKGISIVTKPSAVSGLSKTGLRQKELSDKADMIYELSKPMPKSARSPYTFTPFIKKQ